MINLKAFQKNYRNLIVNRPWSMLLIGILLTIIWMGLKGLSQNPDNHIFL